MILVQGFIQCCIGLIPIQIVLLQMLCIIVIMGGFLLSDAHQYLLLLIRIKWGLFISHVLLLAVLGVHFLMFASLLHLQPVAVRQLLQHQEVQKIHSMIL